MATLVPPDVPAPWPSLKASSLQQSEASTYTRQRFPLFSLKELQFKHAFGLPALTVLPSVGPADDGRGGARGVAHAERVDEALPGVGQ